MDTKRELTMQRAFADAKEQRGLCKRLEAMLREGEPEAALALVRQGLQAIAGDCRQRARACGSPTWRWPPIRSR